ncbi:hypothetical protein CI109_102979 [Kwoniella shandongensis]|uniref:Uncharacterized protein n=1 Tax=Kwoniella shandongensis TaxID=1734106 RepID=A0A5M6C855_9TREE|nr:uncharacterized protein CI109_000167 [Kwoniella shandongensis]KAA5531326.1 hypothetical protein CI109_000167 [Kwoniella shandongensis]
MQYRIHFIEATRDHERDQPEFETTIEVDAHTPFTEAFSKVHQQFHPGDDTLHKYTFLISAPDCPPIAIKGKLTPADFPKFSSNWKIIAVPQA